MKYNKLMALLCAISLLPACGNGNYEEATGTRQYGETCDKENKCVSGLYCESGFCRSLCLSKNDCNHMQSCQNGRCVNNVNNTCNEGWTGTGCDQCEDDYYGPECNKCPNCGEHGTCKAGKSGDGHCVCAGGWEGTDCNTPSECDIGFTGPGCNQCAENFYGEDCRDCNCANGDCNDGKSGDGKCIRCTNDHWVGDYCNRCADGYYGQKCNKHCECNGHGTCSDGTSGTGCICDSNWAGTKCNKCADGYYGPECKEYGHVLDSKNNMYKTVEIGDQTWMAENYRLNTSSYQAVLNSGIYYPDDKKDNMENFGLLYKYDVATKEGFCPEGWHLPTKDDFDKLIAYVTTHHKFTDESDEEKKRNEIAQALLTKNSTLNKYSSYCTDEFGFNAIPAGHYSDSYGYSGLREGGHFWSSTVEKNEQPDKLFIYYTGAHSGKINLVSWESYAYSVRCIKD